MQVRDRKTLAIDTILPIILIVFGLMLATIAIFEPGSARTMTPYQYPTNSIYYNGNSTHIQDETVIKDFMQNTIIGANSSYFPFDEGSMAGVVTIPSSAANLTDQVLQLDGFTYHQVEDAHQPLVMGEVYVQQLDGDYMNRTTAAGDAMVPTYSTILLLNTTSQSIAGVWGGFIHQAYLKQYLKNSKLNLTFVDQPLPLTLEYKSVTKAAAGTTSAIIMAIAWLMISDSLIQNVIREKQRNIKH